MDFGVTAMPKSFQLLKQPSSGECVSINRPTLLSMDNNDPSPRGWIAEAPIWTLTVAPDDPVELLKVVFTDVEELEHDALTPVRLRSHLI